MNYDQDSIKTAISSARDWAELERLKVPARHLLGIDGKHLINERKKVLFQLGQAGASTVRYQSLDVDRLSLAVTMAAQAAVIAMGSFDSLTPDVLKRIARSLPVAALGGMEPAHEGAALPSYNGVYYALRNRLTLDLESGEMAQDLEEVQEIPEVLPAYIRNWMAVGRELTRATVADPGKISDLAGHVMLALEHVCADV